MLEQIIETIKQVTSLKPVVKGGNNNNPIEYLWYRTGYMGYRLVIEVHGSDILKITALNEKIVKAINDFGDNGKFNGSIDINGGGTVTKDNKITMVSYFDVIDYSMK